MESQDGLNLNAGPGIAVREFTLEKPHGRVDYLLFVGGKPAGVIEAKPEGITLTAVEHQSGKYVSGLPSWTGPLVSRTSCLALPETLRRIRFPSAP